MRPKKWLHRRKWEHEMKTLDLDQAAQLLHLHPDTVQQRAKAGEIPAAKPGKCWVFIDEDLLDWLRSQYASNNNEEKNPCSGSAVKSGGLISNTLDAEFDSLVGLTTGSKRKNITTVLRPSFGSNQNSAKPRT
jgi:excisionase family DNA binding protein